MRLYSTAGERGFDLKRLFVCLSAKCRRDARDPLVSPAFQDRRHFAWCSFRFAGETPAIRWSRLHFRIAGISPGVPCRFAAGTPAIRRSVNYFKNDPLITQN
ncbi:MAG: hypothetical protein LBP59_15835 [Planctomycetaceae bacterium]|nr:hypothetical protein [Planctomycetaceae bacterium]